MSQTAHRGDNPYVGPRAFEYDEKNFFGRDAEILELLDLLVAKRIVMLYSPSGAGKTSLVQAGLMPELEKEDFAVLPVIRVNQELAPARDGNRYLYSTLLSLEEGRDQVDRLSYDALTQLSLSEYLTQYEAAIGNLEGTVLIFDQFEEILTLDPTNLGTKRAFFRGVGEALRAPHRWALFSLREDHIAGLDPYLRLIPTRLSTTFRLELLGEAAAREAIQKPARDAGVDFTDPAVRKLVDNLLGKMLVQQADGSTREERGLYVEPVQLQVVCLDLWDRLPAQTARIEPSHIDQVGDVDTALANYYATAVERIARDYDVPERAIRQWCGQELITEGGVRGQILRQEAAAHGMPDEVIQALVDVYLVRAEKRRGLTWYELAHDRLIQPVREDNEKWETSHLSTLQLQAALWDQQGRGAGLLLSGDALTEAEEWSKTHQNILSDVERDFLTRSQAARKVAEQSRRQSRRILVLAIVALAISAVTIGSLFRVSRLTAEVEEKQVTAQAAIYAADARQLTAEAASFAAQEQRETAVAANNNANATATAAAQQQATAEVKLKELNAERDSFALRLETAVAKAAGNEAVRAGLESQLAEVRIEQTAVAERAAAQTAVAQQAPVSDTPTAVASEPTRTPTPPIRLLEDFDSLQNFTAHQNEGVPSNEKTTTLGSSGLILDFAILNYDEPYVGLEWRQEQEDWSSFSEICVCMNAKLSTGLGIGIQVGESDNYKAHQSLILPNQDRSSTKQCLTNNDFPAYCAGFHENWAEKQRLGDLKAVGYYAIFIDAWSVGTHRGEGTLYLRSVYLR